jgi:hypothetical protein
MIGIRGPTVKPHAQDKSYDDDGDDNDYYGKDDKYYYGKDGKDDKYYYGKDR